MTETLMAHDLGRRGTGSQVVELPEPGDPTSLLGGQDEGEDGFHEQGATRAETGQREPRGPQLVGTSRFSSSNQFSTTRTSEAMVSSGRRPIAIVVPSLEIAMS